MASNGDLFKVSMAAFRSERYRGVERERDQIKRE